jgi:hypothetical protein
MSTPAAAQSAAARRHSRLKEFGYQIVIISSDLRGANPGHGRRGGGHRA